MTLVVLAALAHRPADSPARPATIVETRCWVQELTLRIVLAEVDRAQTHCSRRPNESMRMSFEYEQARLRNMLDYAERNGRLEHREIDER